VCHFLSYRDVTVRLPRYTIRSLLIAVAMVAAVLSATVEMDRTLLFTIAVCIFVPAIVIGLKQRLGLRGILVEVIPSWLVVCLYWAAYVWQVWDIGVFAFLIGILAALLLVCALLAAPEGSRLQALSTAALWGILSMLCSLGLLIFCAIAWILIARSR
jgi:hypothetical protein